MRFSLRTSAAMAFLAPFLTAATLSAQDASVVAPSAVVAPAVTPSLNPALVASSPVDVASPVAVTTVASTQAPLAANVSAGVTRSMKASTGAVAPRPGSEASSQSVALMVVGGAILIVGAVIGGNAGTLVMVLGGAMGALGLWDYLR